MEIFLGFPCLLKHCTQGGKNISSKTKQTEVSLCDFMYKKRHYFAQNSKQNFPQNTNNSEWISKFFTFLPKLK